MRYRYLLAALTALLALGSGYWVAQQFALPSFGNAKPETAVRLSDLGGKERSLGEWRGKVLVINFWATWCAPCREEIPLLIDLQKRYGSKGLQVVGIAIDSPEATAAYAQTMGINYPVLLGETDGIALLARYDNRYGSLPFTVVEARDGTVSTRKLGAFGRSELEQIAIQALASK